MRAGSVLLALLLASGALAQVQTPSSPLRIEFVEKVDLTASSASAVFDAYGRRFTLALENNDRLLRGVPAAQKANLSSVQMQRGTIVGTPGSWVRLTSIGPQISGAMWDGVDLYLIGRHDSVAPYLTHALEAAPAQTVVFRLSDTVNFLPPDFCATRGLRPASNNGLDQYKALVNELRSQAVVAATDQLDIALVADSALAQQYSTYSPPENDVRYAMLNTLNLVDGIYDAQLGLMVTASELHVVPAGADPFTASDSDDLLEQLRTYRAAMPALNSKPISHLFTQRQLDGGQTLGIAVLGGACSTSDGISLTSVGFGGLQYSTTFIMAHELGHNLNAQHDTPACGDIHIMWPEYGWAMDGRFSQCSIDQMRPFIDQRRGSCFTSPMYGDVEARVGELPVQIATEPFVWPVYVRSAGSAPVTEALVYIDFPYTGRNASATPTQGTCAPFNSSIRCQLGTIAAGAEVRIDLGITPDYSTSLTVQLNANAANDRYPANNIVTGTVQVQPPATLAMSASPVNSTALVGDLVPITFTLVASGPRTARDVGLTLFNNESGQFVSVTPSQGTCAGSSCELGDMPSGSSAQVTVQVRPQQGGRMSVSGSLVSSNAYRAESIVSATIDSTATFDLAIAPQPAMQLVAIGVPYDIVVPVRANGMRPVPNGRFRMVFSGAVVLSADVGGTPCALDDLFSAYGGGCEIGLLNPGESRTVTVRVRFDSQYDTNVYMAAEVADDELWSNNSATVYYQARHATDVSLNMFPNYAGDLEGREFQATATLGSYGAQDAVDVTATLDVPVGVRILSAALPGGSCVATGVRRIACSLSLLQRNEQPQMTVRMVGDEPGAFIAAWTIAAANDGVPGNNSLDLNLQIMPRADVGIRSVPNVIGLVVGQSREFTLEVFTGTERSAENVVVTFPHSVGSIELESIATSVGTCVLAPATPHCDLGTLAPNTVLQLTPRYRATAPNHGLGGMIYVNARFDINHNNDSASIRIDTFEEGDVDVRVAADSISGTVGQTLVLPTITVSSGTRRAYGVEVDIPMPAFATIEAMSGTGVCVGGSPLTCWLGDKEPNTVNEISITLKLNSTGTFTSNVRVRAMNDTNPANDTTSLQVLANPAPPPPPAAPPASGGKKGGGGRLEWLGIGILAWLAARRRRSRPLH